MDNNKINQLIENVLKLLELKKIKSTSIFFKSLHLFSLSPLRSIVLSFFFWFFVIIQMTLLFPHHSAIDIISDLTVNLNAIVIPIFAVIITGYAIFQALGNGNTMITLLTVKHNEKYSKFAIYNLYFFGIACCYLILIIINFILMFIFKYMPSDWSIPYFTEKSNEFISSILISAYLIVILYLIIEVKSFIFNLFQVFITNASSSAEELVKNSINKNNNENE